MKLIGRTAPLLKKDITANESKIKELVSASNFLVIGGAGSIGQAVTKEIFKRNPKRLHVVDISENNLVELVRDLRSSYGYINGDFKTFALDCGSIEFNAYFQQQETFDYVLNLSALKHVRSEKDPFTLMRMIEVNILNTIKTIELSIQKGVKKYFCVSTDKAANPVNMMGASKRIMEMFLNEYRGKIEISTARFANVAFSDGSLLHGFNQRILKKQPIAAPSDVKRYFVTAQESGELCLLSTLFGKNGEIYFPKLSAELNQITFAEIAKRYLESRGLQPEICSSENQARSEMEHLQKEGKWPCCFFPSDTTGEKDFEEFFTKSETIDIETYENLGIVVNSQNQKKTLLDNFLKTIGSMQTEGTWRKEDIVILFQQMIPNFHHIEKGKNLDSKM